MKAHILKGSKQEIAESLVRIDGEVREAIVFEEDAAPESPVATADSAADVFAEMASYMVDVADVDDSRATLYSRLEGE